MNDLNVQQLKLRTLADRLTHLPSMNYVNAGALIKSAVVVVSASVLLHILGNGLGGGQIIFHLYFWALSALLAGITQITWSQGYLFATSRVGILDFFSPLWVGMFEVMLFLICDPTVASKNVWLHFPTDWLLVAGGHTLASAVLVWHRVSKTSEEDFDRQLREIPFDNEGRPLAKAYMAWTRAAALQTTCAGLVFVGAYAIARLGVIARCIGPDCISVLVGTTVVVPAFVIISSRTVRHITEIEKAMVQKYRP